MNKKISLVGSGSVGSFTALALSKMGADIYKVYDTDKIETHNIPNQFFKLKDVGERKTKALQELLKDFAGIEIKTGGMVNSSTLIPEEIIISAVDSMEARKTIWNQVKQSKPEYYIDSRMGGKIFSLFTIDMSNQEEIDKYEKTLIDDSDTLPIPCTERTIIYNVLGLASFICNQVSKINNEQTIISELHFDYENCMVVRNNDGDRKPNKKFLGIFR